MFGISGTELFLILLFAFLIFGPDKLPQIGRTVGRAIRQFRNAQDEMNRVVRTEIYDPIMDDEPLKNPAEILTGKKKTDKRKVKTVDEGTSTETFAERRARLARERAEREAAAAAKRGSEGEQTTTESQKRPEEDGVESSAASGTSKAPSSSGAETFAERRARLARERAAREQKATDVDGASAPARAASASAGRPLADELYGVGTSEEVDAAAPSGTQPNSKGGDEADEA